MKAINFKYILSCLVFNFLILHVTAVKSQSCTYTVVNAGNCNITVSVDFFDNIGVCSSSGPITISSTTSQVFTCGGSCGSPIVNVGVLLSTVNTASPTGSGFVDINSVNDQGGFTGGATCNGQTNYTMDWHSGETVIGY